MAGRTGFAFDRMPTSRSYDLDGRLHVTVSNLSKSCVSGYHGNEIPGGPYNPTRVYKLLRDPAELERAVSTFNNLPVLCRHVPVSAADHQPSLVVGATGSAARFEAPYLQNSLVIWSAEAIADVESGIQCQLSSAYRYTVDWTPGTFAGVRYDGRMVDIVANHVAIVSEGRVGPDCIVGDEMPTISNFAKRYPDAARIRLF